VLSVGEREVAEVVGGEPGASTLRPWLVIGFQRTACFQR